MLFSKPLDFIAIGDITMDAFIRLKDAKTHCSINNESCELCVRFGDKIPYEFVEVIAGVGNSANAAVAGAKLGLRSGFLGVVGDDAYGKECLEALRTQGVDTRFAVTQKGIATNYHYVLWYESERTILVKHHEYTYSIPRSMPEPRFIYLSSLGENSLPYHLEIVEYLKAHPNVRLAFQPGTFQMKLGVEKLKELYERTEVICINKQEAERILGGKRESIKELLDDMRALGPKIVLITDGRNGACATDGERYLKVPMYPDRKDPVERTGAGDAFASTTISALILGLPLEKALLWGPVNSMAVVEEIGAQRGLLSRENLEKLLASAPETYTVTNL